MATTAYSPPPEGAVLEGGDEVAAGWEGDTVVFDLESPETREAFRTTPRDLLAERKGLVIVDEVQRVPEVFELLRPVCDDRKRQAAYLLPGSASVGGGGKLVAGLRLETGILSLPLLAWDGVNGWRPRPAEMNESHVARIAAELLHRYADHGSDEAFTELRGDEASPRGAGQPP